MSLTESINSFDTKLNQITADIYKEVEKITGESLTAEQKKLSNLIPFLRNVSSTIAELKQTEKELEKTVSEFKKKGDEICLMLRNKTGRAYPTITAPNDLNRVCSDIEYGFVFNAWNDRNLDLVWTNAIYPKLQNGGKWRAKLNGKYVMKCSISFSGGEQRTTLEAAIRPTTTEDDLNRVSTKEIMLVE